MRKLICYRALFAAILCLAFAQTAAPAVTPQKDRPVTDDAITDFVRLKLASDPEVKGGALDVSVKQGIVTLHGSVETPKIKARAEKLARKVKGVKAVINNIEIRQR